MPGRPALMARRGGFCRRMQVIFSVEVVRWTDSGFVHAEDVYEYYFAKLLITMNKR